MGHVLPRCCANRMPLRCDSLFVQCYLHLPICLLHTNDQSNHSSECICCWVLHGHRILVMEDGSKLGAGGSWRGHLCLWCANNASAYQVAHYSHLPSIAHRERMYGAGEIHFVLIGVALQLVAIVLESFRLTMTQLLLQSKGIKLNPITTLYYVAPCCFVALVPIFLYMEFREVMNTTFEICPWHLVANAAAAFGASRSPRKCPRPYRWPLKNAGISAI